MESSILGLILNEFLLLFIRIGNTNNVLEYVRVFVWMCSVRMLLLLLK